MEENNKDALKTDKIQHYRITHTYKSTYFHISLIAEWNLEPLKEKLNELIRAYPNGIISF